MMRAIVLLCTMAGLVSCLVYVVLGLSGLRIFPCEMGVDEQGELHRDDGPPHEVQQVQCSLSNGPAPYTAAGIAYQVALMGLLPLLLTLWPAIWLSRSDKGKTTASRVLGIISISGGLLGLFPALMAPRSFGESAALPLLLAMIVGVISAIVSRGAERMALGGVIGTLLVLLVVKL